MLHVQQKSWTPILGFKAAKTNRRNEEQGNTWVTAMILQLRTLKPVFLFWVPGLVPIQN